ncbi:MAG TPA: potassium-transporting ATPase subunit KdpA [Vicinamibacterales bacterium]|nr:potassium-transporting ATPase subunit KdpA [Vicinamibacterales bacterium]
MRWLEAVIFVGVVLALARPVGLYVLRVFERQPTIADRWLCPVDRWLYRACGVDPRREMTAHEYFICFVFFAAAGSIFLLGLLLTQRWLPGSPADRFLTTPLSFDLAANTAISFATTTTWQAYAGESTLRYLTQTIGLVSQNFLAGAAGLAVGIAFMRGFAREKSSTIGNFWVDIVRGTLWILLPVSVAGAVLLVWQGVPANFLPYGAAHTVEGPIQWIAHGPVATLEFIKNLGTNGGGFFNVNGAHPYANPTPLTNFVGLLAIAVVPGALPVTFGHLIGRPRAGMVLLAVMVILFAGGMWIVASADAGNMEGKEVRFGVRSSALTAVVTSNGATGSYNSMDDSYRPLAALAITVNMLLGEIIFGGLGTGLSSMIMIALVGIVVAGLMIGRTPEYLGKTIRAEETRLIALYTLLTPAIVLTLTALAVVTGAGRAGVVTNTGPHGFTEIVFAYASSMANNGQNMAGLNANSVFYNTTTAAAMLAGRFGLAAVALLLAGRFAAQGRTATTVGTLPCDTPTFGALVLGSVVLTGALCFLPALALGPVVDYFQH